MLVMPEYHVKLTMKVYIQREKIIKIINNECTAKEQCARGSEWKTCNLFQFNSIYFNNYFNQSNYIYREGQEKLGTDKRPKLKHGLCQNINIYMAPRYTSPIWKYLSGTHNLTTSLWTCRARTLGWSQTDSASRLRRVLGQFSYFNYLLLSRRVYENQLWRYCVFRTIQRIILI